MRKILLNLIVALGLALPLFAQPGVALAAGNQSACRASGSASNTAAKDQVLQGISETGNDCSGNGVGKIISEAVNILSIIVGAVAIIMVIVGGFKYITSAGDANKITNAKSTLIYALIGVAIASIAQILVHFVINQVTIATH